MNVLYRALIMTAALLAWVVFVILVMTSFLRIAKAADGPVIPDEKTKIEALKLGYRMNGDSMVGWGSIDLTGEKSIRTIPITPTPKKERR